MSYSCTFAPAGWTCTRPYGHDGPCAALPDPSAAPQREPEASATPTCPECETLRNEGCYEGVVTLTHAHGHRPWWAALQREAEASGTTTCGDCNNLRAPLCRAEGCILCPPAPDAARGAEPGYMTREERRAFEAGAWKDAEPDLPLCPDCACTLRPAQVRGGLAWVCMEPTCPACPRAASPSPTTGEAARLREAATAFLAEWDTDWSRFDVLTECVEALRTALSAPAASLEPTND